METNDGCLASGAPGRILTLGGINLGKNQPKKSFHSSSSLFFFKNLYRVLPKRLKDYHVVMFM